MNEWEIAAIVLSSGLIPCGIICVLGSIGDALVALEVAGTLCTTVLLLLSEGLHRQPFVDLALTFGLLSLIGAFVFARMLERDL
jgi:multisubunit Na+/H+ antiporter MnhF subunit